MLNGEGKRAVLREYAQRYGLRSMIETGLYNGHGSGMALVRDGTLVDYLVIDKQRGNVGAAQAAGFRAMHSDSADGLVDALRFEAHSLLFWLDAHNTTGYDESPDCPLMRELDAILAWPHAAASVVLIDDVRLMDGTFGWPTLEDVVEKLQPVWETSVQDDILRAVPRG